MADIPHNDNAGPAADRGTPDAHGQAAILLVESLIHGLIARSVITVAEAIEIVDIASDVKEEIALDRPHPGPMLDKSRSLLEAISLSLSFDLPKG